MSNEQSIRGAAAEWIAALSCPVIRRTVQGEPSNVTDPEKSDIPGGDASCNCGHPRVEHDYGVGECYLSGCKCRTFEKAQATPEPQGEPMRGAFGHVWPCPLFYVGNWGKGNQPLRECVGGYCATEPQGEPSNVTDPEKTNIPGGGMSCAPPCGRAGVSREYS